jgi:hypothetical protein
MTRPVAYPPEAEVKTKFFFRVGSFRQMLQIETDGRIGGGRLRSPVGHSTRPGAPQRLSDVLSTPIAERPFSSRTATPQIISITQPGGPPDDINREVMQAADGAYQAEAKSAARDAAALLTAIEAREHRALFLFCDTGSRMLSWLTVASRAVRINSTSRKLGPNQ